MMRKRIGLVGARGHTGAELIRLIAGHEGLALDFVSSREWVGQPVSDQVQGYAGDLRYESLDADAVASRHIDALVLALPNEASAPYVHAVGSLGEGPAIIDLSADHRFDTDWYYGLPELTRRRYSGQRRISNPGCYATAMQLAIAPLCGLLAGPPQCFGVSGYSGAGTTPSPRNDPESLRDNLIPYALVGHVHEREAAHQLGLPVEFMPHVAAHFRGITLTANLWLQQPVKRDALVERYRSHYPDEPLVRIVDEAPWVSRMAGQHHAEIGAFAVAAGGRRVVVVATLDNLLKGAATQAMQNLNQVLGFEELSGIPLQHAGAEARA